MATKKAKKVTDNNNFNFKKTIKNIADTTKSVNNQVIETAEDVVEDIMENGTQMRAEAVKTVKTAIDKITEVVTIDNIKETAMAVNKYSLKTANEFVDVAMDSGEKWQGVTAKAMKGGLKLAAKQQDIVFDTLETVKEQVFKGAGRFIKLLK